MTSPSFGIAFSGGGFRATLFHLGVVRALAEAGLLHKVTHISSVSGGSVLAAHVVRNWESFYAAGVGFCSAASMADESKRNAAIESASQQFDEAAEPLLRFVGRDIRNRILRRIPWRLATNLTSNGLRTVMPAFLFRKSRERLRSLANESRIVQSLRREYESLYGTDLMASLGQEGRPKLAILATEVASMEYAWFTCEGFTHPSHQGEGRYVGNDILTIAQCVAASSAFPALFPPLCLAHDRFVFKDANPYNRYVTDAGVYDNLGITPFLEEPFGAEKLPVFVSDATATSEWSSNHAPTLISNLAHTVDIIQQRTAQLQRDKIGLPRRNCQAGAAAMELQSQGRFLLFDIARDTIEAEPRVSPTAQKHLSYIRTDLDSFNAEEVTMLVQHGYSVAWHALSETGKIPADVSSAFPKWREKWPRKRSPRVSADAIATILRNGRSSTLRPFTLYDPVSVLNAALLALLIGLPPALLFYQNKETQERIALERTQEQKRENDRQRRQAFLRIQAHANAAPAPTQEPSFGEPLDVSPPLGFDGVKVVSFERVFDLRNWKSVTTNDIQTRPLEPSLLQTVYSVWREPHAATLIFPLKTSGYGIGADAPGFRVKYYALNANPDRDRFPKQLLLQTDLSNIPANTDFPIAIRATYWNGFQKDVEDAAFKSYTDATRGNMIVLFPKTRVPRSYNFWQIGPAESKPVVSTPSFHEFDGNGLYFEIKNPRKNTTYGTVFSWSEATTGKVDEFSPQLEPTLLPR